MNHLLVFGFMCSFLLISLAGSCTADESPSYVAYAQGGESSITNGSDGTFVITVKDIIPYFHFTEGKENRLIPVQRLTNQTFPINAALVFSGKGNETPVIVQVTNASLSDEMKVLTLQVSPVQYYDGTHLKAFFDRSQGLETLADSEFSGAGITFEGKDTAIDNGAVCTCICSDGSCDPKYTGFLCGAGCPR